MRCFSVLAFAAFMVTTGASAAVRLSPDAADHRDDCWVKRSYPGMTNSTYGIRGTGAELSGYVTWNSFPGAGGVYKVELGAVLESDGDSPYKLFIDGTKVREGNYPYAGGELDCNGSSYREAYLDLGTWQVNKGDKIRYWAMSTYPCGSSHGQYSRFFVLRFTPVDGPADPIPSAEPAPTADKVFVEKDGIVVMEAENTTSSLGQWVKHTSTSKHSFLKGFTGGGAIQFTGNSECGGSPKSILRYYVQINNPSRYRLHIRALEKQLDGAAGDCANDCYVACPSQDPPIGGQTGCESKLTKYVAWRATSPDWTWDLKLECGHHDFSDAYYVFSEPGVYEFQIAGRSKNFFVDRIVLARYTTNPAIAQDITNPESELVSAGATPVRPTGGPKQKERAATTQKPLRGTAVYGIDGRRIGRGGASGRSLSGGVLLMPDEQGVRAVIQTR